MVAAMAAGFATATWKTARIAHGVLARPMYSVSLTGFVEARDIRERTDRFVLRVAQNITAAKMPAPLLAAAA
jgi:competence protein ComEC